MDYQFELMEKVEKLHSAFLNTLCMYPEEKLVTPNIINLNDIKDCLNNIFEFNTCIDVLYTVNTDKPFFGIHINPIISSAEAMTILATDEKVKLGKYQIEFDSKLLSLDLDANELVALTLFEISSYMDSYETIDAVRGLIDLYLISDDDVIRLRDSANYSQLIIYALKDTLFKVSSIQFKEEMEDIISNKLIQATELEEIVISARDKIVSSIYGTGDSVKTPKTVILQWMFMVYKDMKHNSRIATETLKDAKEFTGSKLEIREIDKTLTSIAQIDATIIFESLKETFNSRAMGSLNEISIFKSLKQNGLRSIEDALYEYSLRIKNCDTEEDAMYILRGINTRLSIIEDYIYNTPDISDNERKHWEDVAYKYRALRESLVKKKILNKKQYGLFFDYDQLDYLDKKQTDDEY